MPTTVEMLLYQDATDTLTDADDDPTTAITTEPADGNYVRKTLNLDGAGTNDGDMTTATSGGNWGFGVPALSWDVDGTTGSVDAFALVATVQLSGDGAAANHIVFSQLLEDSGGAPTTIDLAGDVTLNTSAVSVWSVD
jgi:hypothetical protein